MIFGLDLKADTKIVSCSPISHNILLSSSGHHLSCLSSSISLAVLMKKTAYLHELSVCHIVPETSMNTQFPGVQVFI